MQEQLSEIRIYVKGTLKYKWFALVLAWAICLLGWVVVMKMPNTYTSEAKVHVDSSTLLQPLLKGMAIQQDSRMVVHIMKQLMFTRPNLDKVIQLSNLDLFVETDLERNELYENMRKYIKIEGGNQDGLFVISYEADEPNMAKTVVGNVLSVFSDQTQLSTLEDMSSSQKFIENQINDYEVRLREAEIAKEDFKRKNFGLLPGESLDQMGQLRAATDQLGTAQLELNEAISKRNIIRAQMRQIVDEGDAWDSSALTKELSVEDQNIKNLEMRKSDLLLKYTESHPTVIAVVVALKAALKIKKEKDRKRQLSGLPNAGVMANPYVQELKIAINEAEAEVASFSTRVAYLKKNIVKFEQQLNSRLTVETELKNLNRDYETVNNNYQEMLVRREQIRISERVDSETVSIKFKITDPPTKPLSPSGPKRLILYSVVLILSLGIGFGLAFLHFYTKPTYMTTRQLRELTNMPVLGFVSMQMEVSSNEKIRLALFITVFGGLVFVYVGLMGFEYLKQSGISPGYLLRSLF